MIRFVLQTEIAVGWNKVDSLQAHTHVHAHTHTCMRVSTCTHVCVYMHAHTHTHSLFLAFSGLATMCGHTEIHSFIQ